MSRILQPWRPGRARTAASYPATEIPVVAGVSAISTNVSATGASNTVPGTPSKDDVVLAHVSVVGTNPSTISPPAGEGWVLIHYAVSSGGNAGLAVYWKRWGAGYTDNTSVSFTGTSGNMRLVLVRVINCMWAGVPANGAAISSSSANGTTFTAPSVPMVDKGLVFRFFTGGITVGSAGSVTPDSGTQQYGGASYSWTAGNDGCCACGTASSSAGSTGTVTATSTVSDEWVASTIVLLGTTCWSPASLGGMVSWFRADAGVTQSSGSVSGWADQSGNGHDLALGLAPSWSATGWNSARPAVTFASNQYLITSDAGLGRMVQGTNVPFTVLASVKFATSVYATACEWSAGDVSNICTVRVDNTGKAVVDKFTLGTATGAHNISNVFGAVAVTSDGSGLVSYYDYHQGLEISGVSLAGTLTLIERLLVGNNWNVSNACGPMAELAIFGRALSSAEYTTYVNDWAYKLWGGF